MSEFRLGGKQLFTSLSVLRVVSGVMKSIKMTYTGEWEEPIVLAQISIFWSNFYKTELEQPHFKDEAGVKERGKCRTISPK